MPDIVDQHTRSRMMSGIRAGNTAPELKIRKALHRQGYRYRLHAKDLPGKPDLVLPRHRASIFINGCFWHGHDCPLFRMPGTRREFWEAKIARNRQRDLEVRRLLREAGWRQLTIWECTLKGRIRLDFDQLILCIDEWLRGDELTREIAGVR